MKKVLIFGYGSKAGAWKIRGEQLASTIDALAVNGKLNGSLNGIDIAVAVKRPREEDLAVVRALRNVPIVWDIVDAWPQPAGNWWLRDVAIDWLRREIRRIQPDALVVTNQAMSDDCARFKLPTLVLPHHARPGLGQTIIRDEVAFIGYEGRQDYLGIGWHKSLDKACKARGWSFVLNPETINSLDILAALRERTGYPARHWKSNVKLANAQASGTPCIASREQSYLETQSGGEFWADTEEELFTALELLRDRGTRKAASEMLMKGRLDVNVIGLKYRSWLESI